MARRLHHAVLAPVYLLALLLLLELLLQLAALLVRDQVRLTPAQWLTGNTRILAVGDSNTYGLYLKAEEAWPAQLERQWNAANTAHPIEVLNLGYPGTNSFRVRENLPALLDKLSPDIVLIMVGFNDFWTPLETLDSEQEKNVLAWIKNRSRLYRFYLIASRSYITQGDMTFGSKRDGSAVDVNNIEQHLVHMDGDAFYLGTRQGEPARNRDALPENLQAMIEMVRARDAKVYLLTYPSGWGFYPGANKRLEDVADKQGVPLINLTPLFVERCKDGPVSCQDLLFHDGHATAQGNALVAAEVKAQLNLIQKN
ncbi:MAG TPA: GDSL-type esterase/lipase family protein [Pseudomonadales bacterium]|nr:GDSL-type esterase/lipase family protein [Pseudomonadales bacterium]